jgi:DTW domain-containing protein YfiP
MTTPRPRCLKCRRPDGYCYCGALTPVATATRVVFLQHPRERTVAMGTARIARLALANAELHVGVRFDAHPRVRALADDPTAALLYPDGADAGTEPATPPRTLVVIDGTWTTARKMLARNPVLACLPRIRLNPSTPGAYRIRREPAPHCLSTVEAVAAALAALEGGAERFAPMLAAFHDLIERQIAIAAVRRVPYHHARRRVRARDRAFANAVVVQTEGSAGDDGHELVVLVAERVATGERFVAVAAPRSPLRAGFAQHTGWAVEQVRAGAPIADVAARWAAFLAPDDVLIGWGPFSARLLERERMRHQPWRDLRSDVIQRLGRRPGGAERAAALLTGTEPVVGRLGRPGRQVAALAALVRGLAGENRSHLALSSQP